MDPVAIFIIGFVSVVLGAVGLLGIGCCVSGTPSRHADGVYASLLLPDDDGRQRCEKEVVRRAASVAGWPAWQRFALQNVQWSLWSNVIFLMACLGYLVSTIYWVPEVLSDDVLYGATVFGALGFFIEPFFDLAGCWADIWHATLDEADALADNARDDNACDSANDSATSGISHTVAVLPAGGAQSASAVGHSAAALASAESQHRSRSTGRCR
jgi:hypothetical protein